MASVNASVFLNLPLTTFPLAHFLITVTLASAPVVKSIAKEAAIATITLFMAVLYFSSVVVVPTKPSVKQAQKLWFSDGIDLR